MVQRYKFESKSQQIVQVDALERGCFQWSKDTNLKANHNVSRSIYVPNELFSMVQRYKFESKSQLNQNIFMIEFSCFQWSKDTNLKANHNPAHINIVSRFVVFNGPKIQI